YRRLVDPGGGRRYNGLSTPDVDRVAGRTGRSSDSGLIEPSSFSSAYSTSDFQDSAVRSSSRSRGYRGCGRTVLKPTDRKKSAGARHPEPPLPLWPPLCPPDPAPLGSPNLASPNASIALM